MVLKMNAVKLLHIAFQRQRKRETAIQNVSHIRNLKFCSQHIKNKKKSIALILNTYFY